MLPALGFLGPDWAALAEFGRKGGAPGEAPLVNQAQAQRLGSGIFIRPLQLCQAIRVLIAPPSAA